MKIRFLLSVDEGAPHVEHEHPAVPRAEEIVVLPDKPRPFRVKTVVHIVGGDVAAEVALQEITVGGPVRSFRVRDL
jgi:hypothetical protein